MTDKEVNSLLKDNYGNVKIELRPILCELNSLLEERNKEKRKQKTKKNKQTKTI